MIGLWTWLWQARSSIPNNRGPDNVSPGPGTSPISPLPPVKGKGQWCLPKSGADPGDLQRNIDYVCGLGLNCGPIQEGGPCFDPNTVRAHAAYAMNLYYQSTGKFDYNCDFKQTGALTDVDPSMTILSPFFFFFPPDLFLLYYSFFSVELIFFRLIIYV